MPSSRRLKPRAAPWSAPRPATAPPSRDGPNCEPSSTSSTPARRWSSRASTAWRARCVISRSSSRPSAAPRGEASRAQRGCKRRRPSPDGSDPRAGGPQPPSAGTLSSGPCEEPTSKGYRPAQRREPKTSAIYTAAVTEASIATASCPDCSVIPGSPSPEQSGQITGGFHDRKRETTVVLLSEEEEPTDHGAGFHRLASSVEVVEVAAAGMSTVVAVNSATG